MPTASIEERIEKLESKVRQVQNQLEEQMGNAEHKKRGWRWFVGIDARTIPTQKRRCVLVKSGDTPIAQKMTRRARRCTSSTPTI